MFGELYIYIFIDTRPYFYYLFYIIDFDTKLFNQNELYGSFLIKKLVNLLKQFYYKIDLFDFHNDRRANLK